jgi:hypothetical protein
METFVAFVVNNFVAIIIVATIYFFGFSFTMGFIAGKEWFRNRYYADDTTEFWLTCIWPLFWMGWFFFNTRWFFWYFVRYSPFWLAYDFGMYLAGAKRNTPAG